MKWVNHQIVTGVAMYAITDDLLLTGAAVLGAVIPDKIEGNPWQKRRFWRWNMTHRGWSHCPTVYLAIIGIIYFCVAQGTLVSYTSLWLRDMGIAFFMGAIFHIIEDAFCGKVPLLTPSMKVGVRVFKVGSIWEYVFAIVSVLIIYAISKMI